AEHVLEDGYQEGVHQGDAQIGEQASAAEQVDEVVKAHEVDLRLETGPVGEGVDEVEQRGHEEEDAQDAERRDEEPVGVVLVAALRPGTAGPGPAGPARFRPRGWAARACAGSDACSGHHAAFPWCRLPWWQAAPSGIRTLRHPGPVPAGQTGSGWPLRPAAGSWCPAPYRRGSGTSPGWRSPGPAWSPPS